ncbi:hypothetical protein NKJ46_26245 [Mesorhizobium sp. M0166]|uniref:hypothetical protein n=1 Tax=Mesorhizobium sp. M0166 TaxID=2956902 RepID=UPI00333C7698
MPAAKDLGIRHIESARRDLAQHQSLALIALMKSARNLSSSIARPAPIAGGLAALYLAAIATAGEENPRRGFLSGAAISPFRF